MAITGKAITIPRITGQNSRAGLLAQGWLLRKETAILGDKSKRAGDHTAEQPQIAKDIIDEGVAQPFPTQVGKSKHAQEKNCHGNREKNGHWLEAEKGHRGQKRRGKQKQA